jgi:hypothetical protein
VRIAFIAMSVPVSSSMSERDGVLQFSVLILFKILVVISKVTANDSVSTSVIQY